MSLLSLLGISTAYASSAAPAPQGGLLSALPMLVLFVVAFYLMIIRPQSKRAKEQRQLMESLAVGDEVLTGAGIMGRLVKIQDDYVVLLIGKDIEVTFQKNAVATVLPKGTIASIA